MVDVLIEHEPKRRLAGVMSADVVGYTRLMELDEKRTHARLMELRRLIMLPEIERHQGRVVKNTGDGFLAMFDTAEQAVGSAIAIQRGVLGREASVDKDRRITLRMGINFCTVMVEDHDIYGSGVNIAARLQGYADPGGIVISGAVADIIGSPPGLTCVDLGEQLMRNLKTPVRMLALRLDDTPTAILGETFEGVEARPSIAVLPFHSQSADVEPYFAAGFVDNIIGALGSLKELFVIARGSTLAFSGPTPDLDAVRSKLGVRYVLHGAVERNGDRFDVSFELTDTETQRTLIRDRRPATREALFDLQDQIAIDVVTEIAPQVRDSELQRSLRKRPHDLTVYDLVLQALGPLYALDYASFSRARGLLQRAMAIEPTYAPAFAYAAIWHIGRVAWEWSPDALSDSREALRLSELAIGLDGDDASGFAIRGYQRAFLQKDFAAAQRDLQRSLAVSPNYPLAWGYRAAIQGFVGDHDDAITSAWMALRLAPIGPQVAFYEHMMSQCNFLNGDYHEAARWGWQSYQRNSRLCTNLRILIPALMLTGRDSDAQRLAAQYRQMLPHFKIGKWVSRTPLPQDKAEQIASLLEKAGLHY